MQHHKLSSKLSLITTWKLINKPGCVFQLQLCPYDFTFNIGFFITKQNLNPMKISKNTHENIRNQTLIKIIKETFELGDKGSSLHRYIGLFKCYFPNTQIKIIVIFRNFFILLHKRFFCWLNWIKIKISRIQQECQTALKMRDMGIYSIGIHKLRYILPASKLLSNQPLHQSIHYL